MEENITEIIYNLWRITTLQRYAETPNSFV